MNPAVSAQIEASGLSAGSSLQSYLTMMAVRLIEIRRILKPSGSMFLHCDTTAGAYLRVLCDAIFGYAQCRNEIRWKRTGAHSAARRFGPIHDTIFFYSRSDSYQWNHVYQTYDDEYIKQKYRSKDEQGEHYMTDNLTGDGLRNGASGQPWREFDPSAKGRHWAIPRTFPGANNIPEDLHDALDYPDCCINSRNMYVKRRRSVLREHVGALFRDDRCCSWRGSICRLGESCARRTG